MEQSFVAIYLIIVVFAVVVITALAPWIAKRKGKSALIWLVYALVLPGVSFVHAILIQPRGLLGRTDDHDQGQQPGYIDEDVDDS